MRAFFCALASLCAYNMMLWLLVCFASAYEPNDADEQQGGQGDEADHAEVVHEGILAAVAADQVPDCGEAGSTSGDEHQDIDQAALAWHFVAECLLGIHQQDEDEVSNGQQGGGNGSQVNWPGNAYPDDLKLTDFNQEIPFRGNKCDAYEGGVRVPGFVHWRGKIPARNIDTPVHVVDWMKTIGGFIGIEPQAPQGQPKFDGTDNSALFLTKADPPTRMIYQLWGKPGKRWALSLGDWKLVHYGKNEPKKSDWQLYDLNKDAKESKNLAKKHPEQVEQLHQLFINERAKDRKTKSNL